VIVYRAEWVVPVTSPPIHRGAVAVEDGQIAWVGTAGDAPGGEARELGAAALLPGLINVHTHLELTLMRGFLEQLPFFEWIVTLTKARREVLTDDDLREAARFGIVEGLAGGITTFADTSESGVVLGAMQSAGVRGIMYQELFGPDPRQRDDALAQLAAKVTVLRERETDLVRVGVSPHAPYSVSEELFGAVAKFALANDLPVAIHVAESEEETNFVCNAEGPWAESHRKRGIAVVPRGCSSIEYLRRTGVLEVSPLLIHCVQADAGDVAVIREANCPVAHCPTSNAKLGHGTAPLMEMLEAGVPTGIGSDSVASNNSMDLLADARVALLAQRARARRPDVLDSHRMLSLCTLEGARALGIAGRVGSIERGKDADLAAFPLEHPSLTPLHDPVDALIHSAGPHRASMVAVKGRELVQDGRVLADNDHLRARISADAARLAQWRRR
jgi:cytosine/adenosine deaminase-related metal-dependent hydrolase